jgi:hypothetical protein
MVVVADTRGESLPAGTPVVLRPVDELAGANGLASGCGVGPAGAELAGVVVALAEVRFIGDFDGVLVVWRHLL